MQRPQGGSLGVHAERCFHEPWPGSGSWGHGAGIGAAAIHASHAFRHIATIGDPATPPAWVLPSLDRSGTRSAAVEIISTCRGVSVPAPSLSGAAPPAVGDTPSSPAWKTRPVSDCEQGALWRLVPDPATAFPRLCAPGTQLVPVIVSTP